MKPEEQLKIIIYMFSTVGLVCTIILLFSICITEDFSQLIGIFSNIISVLIIYISYNKKIKIWILENMKKGLIFYFLIIFAIAFFLDLYHIF